MTVLIIQGPSLGDCPYYSRILFILLSLLSKDRHGCVLIVQGLHIDAMLKDSFLITKHFFVCFLQLLSSE